MDSSERGFELLKAGDFDGLRYFLDRTPGSAEARDLAGVSLLMHTLYRGRRDLAMAVGCAELRQQSRSCACLWNRDRCAYYYYRGHYDCAQAALGWVADFMCFQNSLRPIAILIITSF